MTAPASRLAWTDVRDELRARILTRVYKLGDKLPRDADLAAAFGCTRTTVHRAMTDLASAGLIERVRKGGTHVKADPVTRATLDIPITRLEVQAAGCAYSHRVIDRKACPSPPHVMARFALTAPRAMLRLVALHLADDRPYILEDRWIDLGTCPEVADLDFAQISANEWLVRHKPYARVELRFGAAAAQGDIALHLGAAKGAALLVMERITWDAENPITFVQSYAPQGYEIRAQS
ncbi:MAG: GntR family transcriptional regulator [Cypionkella sp.]|nr:GntR family transcriptional regulator [Cypionkella sp.]